MSNFTVPYSSSLPSTPDSRRGQRTDTLTGTLNSNPSTTPAGPPNPQIGSFTPAGPPPSTPFGSSQIRTRETEDHAQPVFSSFGFGVRTSAAPRYAGPPDLTRAFGGFERTKNGSPAKARFQPRQGKSTEDVEDGSGSDGDDNNEDDEDNDIQMSSTREELEGGPLENSNEDDEDNDIQMSSTREELEGGPLENSRVLTMFLPTNDSTSESAVYAGQRTQALRGTNMLSAGGIIDQHQDSASPFGAGQQKANQSPIPSIARDLAGKSGLAALHEPDDMILGTEELLDRLDHWQAITPEEGSALNGSISLVTEKVSELWRSISNSNTSESEGSNGDPAHIGPEATASPVTKATFLTDLLLPIHHPPRPKPQNTLPQTRAYRSLGFSETFKSQASGKPHPVPRVLIDWLAKHHDPYRDALLELSAYQPNPTYHDYFWDITLTSLLRGKLDAVIRMLKQADFRHPQVAVDDNVDQSQLPEMRLGSIRMVINRAIQILEQCPASTDENWDVNGNDWSVFRIKVSQASRDLKELSGDPESDEDEPAVVPFSAEHFGIRGRDTAALSLTKASRQAQSKVPWPIYQNLKALYGILGGDATEIIAYAQDWVEAALGLTIWWNGDFEPAYEDSPRSRDIKASLSQSVTRQSIGPVALYLERLTWSFRRVTDPKLQYSFQIDTLNKVEVGLACILQGDIEGVIGLLRGWSLVVTSAVIHIAKRGGWLDASSSGDLLSEFDESDLMVLSYNQPKKDQWKDDILVEYAEALFSRDRLCSDMSNRGVPSNHAGKRMVEREGWELGIQVLGRLDDMEVASKKVGELLDRLPLNSGSRVDKLLRICRNIGLGDQAIRIAEKYADSLADSSYNYGETLIYYAQAHQQKKLKNVLDLLVSFCLVQSMAYPPESELDDHLKRLISSPKEVLTELSGADIEAARLLQLRLSGYATVRKFYDLRDEEVNQKPGQKPKLREQARKRQALSTLLAVIESAADNIHGGLYDEKRESVVSVDGLLVLLGEAMVFVDQLKSPLDLSQAFRLLKAIEDIQTVTARVYSQCEDLFQAAVSSARERQGRPARDTLRKSISSLTASSGGFSLIGSSVLGAHSEMVIKADVKRGWDWRRNLPGTVEGKDLLQMLRLGLAKELARGWLSGGGGGS